MRVARVTTTTIKSDERRGREEESPVARRDCRVAGTAKDRRQVYTQMRSRYVTASRGAIDGFNEKGKKNGQKKSSCCPWMPGLGWGGKLDERAWTGTGWLRKDKRLLRFDGI